MGARLSAKSTFFDEPAREDRGPRRISATSSGLQFFQLVDQLARPQMGPAMRCGKYVTYKHHVRKLTGLAQSPR